MQRAKPVVHWLCKHRKVFAGRLRRRSELGGDGVDQLEPLVPVAADVPHAKRREVCMDGQLPDDHADSVAGDNAVVMAEVVRGQVLDALLDVDGEAVGRVAVRVDDDEDEIHHAGKHAAAKLRRAVIVDDGDEVVVDMHDLVDALLVRRPRRHQCGYVVHHLRRVALPHVRELAVRVVLGVQPAAVVCAAAQPRERAQALQKLHIPVRAGLVAHHLTTVGLTGAQVDDSDLVCVDRWGRVECLERALQGRHTQAGVGRVWRALELLGQRHRARLEVRQTLHLQEDEVWCRELHGAWCRRGCSGGNCGSCQPDRLVWPCAHGLCAAPGIQGARQVGHALALRDRFCGDGGLFG
eukprot:m.40255 g.40255  ORF g.40255 m.40255 type:complete len:352 (-) comp5602_c1_seq1:4184-5239(-)